MRRRCSSPSSAPRPRRRWRRCRPKTASASSERVGADDVALARSASPRAGRARRRPPGTRRALRLAGASAGRGIVRAARRAKPHTRGWPQPRGVRRAHPSRASGDLRVRRARDACLSSARAAKDGGKQTESGTVVRHRRRFTIEPPRVRGFLSTTASGSLRTERSSPSLPQPRAAVLPAPSCPVVFSLSFQSGTRRVCFGDFPPVIRTNRV